MPILIHIRKLGLHVENGFPVDKDISASYMLENIFMSIFSVWHWLHMTASLPSCPAKTGTCILPPLGSSCKGCAGPDVQASFNPWESPSWHLDSLLPWPNSRMDSAIWNNCGCDICNICQRMVPWCGQDWFQSPTLLLPDWASLVAFLSLYLWNEDISS